MARKVASHSFLCHLRCRALPRRASILNGCLRINASACISTIDDGCLLRPVSPYGLHPDECTIAESAQAAGVRDGVGGECHLGDQVEFLPTRQGFDCVLRRALFRRHDGRESGTVTGSTWPPLPLMGKRKPGSFEAPCDRDGLTKRYTQRAMQWIAETR